MPASPSALGLCFIYSCLALHWATASTLARQPRPACEARRGGPLCGCPAVWEGDASGFHLSPESRLYFSTAQGQGGTDLESVLAENGVSTLNSPGP